MKPAIHPAALGVAVLLTLTGAAPQKSGPVVQGATQLPVLTATQRVGATISACMYPGAQPETYRVISHSCRGGASVCTAWVQMRTPDEMEMLTGDFDLTNPPVEATGPTCERPEFRPSGRLPAPRP